MSVVTPEISIVVPVFNSSKSLPILVSKIVDAMRLLLVDFEILLVDDCSSDHTWQAIENLCQTNTAVIGLRLAKNKGQWVATLAGISRSHGEYIVTIDDDLEYDPADIVHLYKAITGGYYQLVCGIAQDKYLNQGKNQLSLLRKKILTKVWGTAVTDSFKIFSRSVVFREGRFIPEILIDAYIEHNLDKRFWTYYPVQFQRRYSGTSNYGFLRKLRLFFLYSTHYFKNPAKLIFAGLALDAVFTLGAYLLWPINLVRGLILACVLLFTFICIYFVLLQWARSAAGYQIVDSRNIQLS